MEERRFRIAIIGGGIAGAAVAAFLRDSLGERVSLTLYEREPRVGGRLMTADIGGIAIEAGGTIIHESNRYMVDFVDRLGLERLAPHQHEGAESDRVGVWDGQRLVFETSRSPWRTRLRALRRYGLSVPLRLQRLVTRNVAQWAGIYERLSRGDTFDSPGEMLSKLGLAELLSLDGRSHLAHNGISGRFVDEYASPVGRIMYGQDVSMHGFATSIALAGAGLAGSLFSVGGGNALVCVRLLEMAGVEVKLRTAVRAVQRTDGYVVETTAGDRQPHDAVILAAPLELANIEFRGIDLPTSALRERPFQTTHATFVLGRPDAAFFGAGCLDDLPETILTVEDASIPFSSLGWVGRDEKDRRAYKLFSREPAADELLESIFEERRETQRIRWAAYPVLSPAVDLPPFRLAHHLYWVGAMEFAASTMETEAVAARNVANLLAADLVSSKAGHGSSLP